MDKQQQAQPPAVIMPPAAIDNLIIPPTAFIPDDHIDWELAERAVYDYMYSE